MVDRVAQRAAPPATTVLVAVGLVSAPDGHDTLRVVAALVVVVLVGVLGARAVTGRLLLAGLAVAVVATLVVCAGSSTNLGLFALCVLCGWASVSAPLREALLVGLVAVVGLLAQLVPAPDPGWAAWTFGTTVSALAFAGVRRQQQLLDRLHEAQAGLAERTRAEERARVAAELHDVVGHALTVSLLHISSARLALADGAEDADDALAEAERLSRRSLAEVRSAVGLVRDQSAAPLPGAAEVDELVESFRRAGARVDLAVEGDLAVLGATEGLAVYRILQEALTNVVRHAPGTPASVNLSVGGAGAGGTRLVVDSPGAPGPGGEGNGVVGLRERAEALGGWATAGPHGRGWRVEAVLP